MKKAFIFLLIFNFSFAQNANRKYLSHKWENNILEIKTSDGFYKIIPYSEKIIETSFIPNGQNFITASEAVVMKPENVKIKFTETNNALDIFTAGIKVIIDKTPFKITYFNKNEAVLSEKLGYIKKDSTEILNFNLDNKEVLYGGGARVLGMNRRGNRLQLYNRAHYGYETKAELMNYSLPIVISSRKYMVHFDNAPIGYLDLDSKKDNTLQYETISGRKTYQIIIGDSWEDLISNYTLLTGRQPLPPKWAFGNFASRFGYHSEAEARKTIQKFKENDIPVDAIILDLYWFGKDIKGTMGNLEVFRDSFPNFEKMVTDFNTIGVKTIPITEPFILTTSSKWKDALDKKVLATKKDGSPAIWDFYFGNTGLVDVFKPEGKNWFWNVYKDLSNKGVGGVWGDLGEPEVFPSFANTATGKADEVHNLYGNQWAKIIYEGYKKDFPKQRPFILMRSGAAGSQRYGMIPWSGDVNRTWGGLSGQTEIALQMGMQGLAYMHSDLGGFAGANLDDELYVRWLQYGVFNPIFRPHAQEEVPSEPVFRSEKAKLLAKKAIQLRYQFLTYNYTLAFQNQTSGIPFMKPLFFEDDNPILFTKSDGYLWGKDILVYPVIEKGQKTKEIYFPNKTNWFDFYTAQKYEGGKTVTVSLEEESIPTFVKANTALVLNDSGLNTETINLNKLKLLFYYDPKICNTETVVYNDNGINTSAESFVYEKINIKAITNISKISLRFTPDNYHGNTQNKSFSCRFKNIFNSPKTILLDGKKIKYTFDRKSKSLEFDIQIKADKQPILEIKL